MNRYIDADALMQNIPNEEMIAKIAVAHAPSIDIVFCKECKYYEAKEDWCYWRDEAITADDFCSYGEREK